MTESKDKLRRGGMTIERSGLLYGTPVPLDEPVRFVHGLLGFEDILSYRFTMNDGARPFLFMEGDDGRRNVSFVCVDTFFVHPDYRLPLPGRLVHDLGLRSPDEAAVLSIVTVGTTVEETTANLMSPIVINVRNRRAEQAVLEDCGYPVRYRIWEALRAREEQLMAAC